MINYKTLKNIIKAGGATISKNGTLKNFKTGYQASFEDIATLNLNNLNDILKNINNIIKTLRAGEFCGLWIESNKIYIDKSKRIQAKKDAIYFGKLKKQLSIYDWHKKSCIYL